MKIALNWVESKLYPAVEDVLKTVLPEFGITEYEEWSEMTTDHTLPTLCFGAVPNPEPLTYVKTMSQKQLLAFGSSLSELRQAITRLLTPPTFTPMKYKINGRIMQLGQVVVVDIETGGDIETMLPEETWLLSVALNDGKQIVVLTEEWLQDPANKAYLASFLTSGRKLIAHNMKFDFRTLSAQLGTPIKGHLDTMLLQHVLNPATKQGDYNLKKMAERYLGAPDWDSAIGDYVKGAYKARPEWYDEALWNKYVNKINPKAKKVVGVKVGYEAIPRDILYEYNAYDVYWTWHLYQYLSRAAHTDERFARVAKHEFSMSNLFQDVERNGVAVDVEYTQGLSAQFGEEKDAAIADIRRITGDAQFNPNSPPQVKSYFNSVGYPIKSTGEKILEKLVLPEGSQAAEFYDALMRARKATKMKGTYADGILYKLFDGLVYPDFLVHGTSTGRLSSRAPNIQNIPRDEEGKVSLRRVYVPRDVAVRSLVSVDYSQAELRVMACLSNDEYLISLFQPGMPDFFDSLMPVTYPRLDLATLDKNTKKNKRANLKGVIYGLSYGRRAPAIAQALGMPVKEAASIVTNYFRAAPAFYDWRQWVEEVALSDEHTLVSPFGRYYQADIITGQNRQSIINSAMAFLPQSTASDICVLAAMEVQKWLHEYDAYIIATIHDAILMDVPDIHIAEVERRVQYEMEAAGDRIFNGVVPFATEATHGKSWEGI